MKSFIYFGTRKIDFQLIFSKRKTLGITVNPEMEVIIKAPNDTEIEKIKVLVKKKAPWIIKQQSFFIGFSPKTPERKYVSGETHLYLGRHYKLKVIRSEKNFIHFNAREIQLHVKEKGLAKRLLNDWYRLRAKLKFSEIAEPLIQKFKKYKVEPQSLYI